MTNINGIGTLPQTNGVRTAESPGTTENVTDATRRSLANAMRGARETARLPESGSAPEVRPAPTRTDEAPLRPLSGTGAELVDRALAALAEEVSFSSRLSELRDLRTEAEASGDLRTARLLDDMALESLFMPVEESVGGLPGAYATPLRGAVRAILSGASAAETLPQLEAKQAEVLALKASLKSEGVLTTEAEAALSILLTLIENKAGVLTLLATAEARLAAVQEGRESIRELAELVRETLRQTEADATDRPAFGHTLLGSAARSAGALLVRLGEISAERSRAFEELLTNLEGAALKEGADLDACSEALGEIERALEAKAETLLASDEASLRDAVAALRNGLEALRTVALGGRFDVSESVAELEEIRGRLTELETKPLPKGVAERVAKLVTHGDVRIAELRSAARTEEASFEERMRALIDSGTDGLNVHKAIGERLDAIEGRSGTAQNLTDSERLEARTRLLALDQEAWTAEFADALGRAQSARLDAPALTEILAMLEAAFPEGEARSGIEGRIREASVGALADLTARIDAVRSELAAMDWEALRGVPVGTWLLEAERKLLPDERTALRAPLEELLKELDAALFSKAEPLLGRTLTSEETAGAKALLRAAGYHPTAVKLAGEAEFSEVLRALGTDGGGLTPEAERALERLMARHPELDNTVLALRLERATPEEITSGAVADRHEALALRRDVMIVMREAYSEKFLARLGVTGDVASPELLERLLAQSASEKKLSEADLRIAAALWGTRRLEGMTFVDFRATLPESLRRLNGLESLLASGLEGSRRLRSITGDLKKLSKGFGGNADLERVCARLIQGDDAFRAAALLTTLARNYVGGMSFTGRQAMEGNASALRAALSRSMRSPDLTDGLKDAYRRLKGEADDTTRRTAREQILAFCEGSEVLTAQIRRLEADTLAYERAKKALLENEFRTAMIGVLERARPGDAEVERLKAGKPAEVMGAELSLGLLALRDILTTPGLTDAERSLLAGELHFQRHLDFDRLQGTEFGTKRNSATLEFRAKLEAFKGASTHAAREAAKSDLIAFLDAHGTDEKARAVLYFKKFREESNVDNFAAKFAQIAKSDVPGLEAVKTRLQKELITKINRGSVEEKSASAADRLSEEAVAQMRHALHASQRVLGSRVLQTINDAVRMAVCEAFLASGKSLETILAERGGPSGEAFLRSVLDECRKLGLEELAARPFVETAVRELAPDTFGKALSGTQTDPALRLRGFLVELKTPAEMRALAKTGVFERLAADMVRELAGGGKTLTLSTERSVGLGIPVFESGGVDVTAHLGAAVRNGLAVWADPDGTHHVTLMRTREGSGGVSVEGLLDVISIEAKASLGIGTGCDLEFSNASACTTFLGHLLSGSASVSDLGLCSVIRSATSVGIGGELSVGLEADPGTVAGAVADEDGLPTVEEGEEESDAWFKFEVGLTLSGSLAWDTVRNADGIERSRVRVGSFEGHVGLTLVPQEKVDEIGEKTEKLAEFGIEAPARLLEEVSGFNALERGVALRFEERETVRTAPDGRLLGVSAVRVFALESPDEVEGVLTKMGVSDACLKAVLEDAQKLGGLFRLEVERALPPSVVDEVVAKGGPVPMKRCRPTEVRLIVPEGSAEVTRGLEREHLTLSRTIAGGLERTVRYAA